ncbi:MAG: hypothetical protein FWD61_09055 [Phycisphaerales bacterium]|nr:hypothetical protein [Phycisphaerales bacterium]
MKMLEARSQKPERGKAIALDDPSRDRKGATGILPLQHGRSLTGAARISKLPTSGFWLLASGFRPHNRGTAEIELLLVIPILLALLFITGGLLSLGEARLQNAWDAQQKAYADAIHNAPPRYTTGTLQPPAGFTDVRPGLPNRLSQDDNSVTVTYAANVPLKPVTLTDTAAFASPAWAYSAFPVYDSGGSYNDATTTHDWYADYAGEVRTPLEDPLGLSPSNPP